MAEINNSLALGIKPMEMDISKPLEAAAKINSLRASTAQTEQETGYRQFQQDQGGGYRATEQNTLAEAHQKQLGVAGQIGNMMVNAKSMSDRQQAIKAAEDSGVKIEPDVKQHLLSAPDAQFKQYGQNLQRAGQSSTTNIEQNPTQIGNRAAAGASGTAAGAIDEPYKPPGKPMTAPQVEGAISSRINRDGSSRVLSLEGNVPDQQAAPAVSSLEKKGAIEARNIEKTALAPRLAEEYSGIKQEAMNAATTKYLLRNLNDDAERFPTGKGANTAGAIKQWMQAAGQLPGVGPGIKKIIGDYSDPVAAFEALQKNAGQLTRATLKDAEGKAASEYAMIQKQLPNAELSPGGLKLITAQMTAPEDYKQAKLQAADKWRASHNGTIDGFASDWNKNIGPGAFLFGRLPPNEQTGLVERLKKTPAGMEALQSLRGQMKWAHENGLSSVLD